MLLMTNFDLFHRLSRAKPASLYPFGLASPLDRRSIYMLRAIEAYPVYTPVHPSNR